MSFRRRRNQAQRVSLRPQGAFTDSSDFIDDNFSRPGAAYFSATPSGVPRSNLDRLVALDVSTERASRGYGGASPHASPGFAFLRRRRLGLPVSAAVRLPHSPLQAQRRNADRLEFTRLRTPNPARVAYCVRRHVRRSVLFAVGIGGRRHSAPGRGGHYRRSLSSSWSC